MASLYISEFPHGVSSDGTMKPEFLPQPSLVDQKLAIGAGAVPSAAFSANTKFVLLQADAACSVLFSAAGTAAAATNMRVPAGVYIIFGVIPGSFLSVITNS